MCAADHAAYGICWYESTRALAKCKADQTCHVDPLDWGKLVHPVEAGENALGFDLGALPRIHKL